MIEVLVDASYRRASPWWEATHWCVVNGLQVCGDTISPSSPPATISISQGSQVGLGVTEAPESVASGCFPNVSSK